MISSRFAISCSQAASFMDDFVPHFPIQENPNWGK
jgi:hypothetical protein